MPSSIAPSSRHEVLDPPELLAERLRLAWLRLRTASREAFRAQGVAITPEQWSVVRWLMLREGRSPTELARVTGRDRAGVSRLVAGLVRQGWVRTRPDPSDGRRQQVWLTPSGRAVGEALQPAREAVLVTALGDLDEATRRVLTEGLAQVHERLVVHAEAAARARRRRP